MGLLLNPWQRTSGAAKKKKEEEEEENIKLKENPGVTFPSVWTAMRFLQLKQLRKWIKKFFFFF